MNSLEASQNYNAILNLANISSGESEPSSTTSGKRKRKTARNFSQDLSYSSNNSDGTMEKLKKIRKSHSEFDNNDNGSKLKDNLNKDSKRHHKTSHKSYDDDDYDEIDDIDDVEDDNDDDDYIPRNDGKTSRNLFNKKHDNNSLRKTKFELGDELDHGNNLIYNIYLYYLLLFIIFVYNIYVIIIIKNIIKEKLKLRKMIQCMMINLAVKKVIL